MMNAIRRMEELVASGRIKKINWRKSKAEYTPCGNMKAELLLHLPMDEELAELRDELNETVRKRGGDVKAASDDWWINMKTAHATITVPGLFNTEAAHAIRAMQERKIGKVKRREIEPRKPRRWLQKEGKLSRSEGPTEMKRVNQERKLTAPLSKN